MKRLRRALLWPLGMAGLLGLALPAYGNGNNCSFQAKGLSMSFGNLNPASGSNVTVAVAASTLGANRAGDCAPGQPLLISGDNGLNFNGSRRLRNIAGADFIAYSLNFPWSSSGPGNNSFTNFTFNGTILWSAYANASAGGYSDTVMISVTP